LTLRDKVVVSRIEFPRYSHRVQCFIISPRHSAIKINGENGQLSQSIRREVVCSISSTLVDYHIHSKHSVDGQSSLGDMCSRALELGFSEIGFCEHVEFEPKDKGLGFLNYEGYSEDIDQARSQYGNLLTIRKGVELSYNRVYETQISDWLDGKDFDYLAGGVHYIDHIAFDIHEDLGMPFQTSLQKYYTEIRGAAESGLFDVIAHFDLIREYVPQTLDPVTPVSGIIDTALEQIVQKGTYLEINSRKRVNRDPFPSRRLILRYLTKGGKRFSFGSDAHSTEELGVGVTQIIDLLHGLRTRDIHLLFE